MKLRGNYRLTAKAYARCILDFTKRIMISFCNDGFRWAVDVGIAKDFCVAGFEEGFMVFTNDEILSCFQPVTDIIVEMICDEIHKVSKTGRKIEVFLIPFCLTKILTHVGDCHCWRAEFFKVSA